MATRNPATCHFKFQALSGFFVDYVTEAQRDPSFRVTTLPRLGLTEREYETDRLFDGAGHGAKPWDRFKKYVEHLNTQSPEGTTYKVLYITRHGYGYHNAYEAKVGREAWNSHWSHLDGDGQIIWADSHLNEAGTQQASSLSMFFTHAVQNDHIPLPASLYTSPLARCLQTTSLVYSPLFSSHSTPFHPVIKERLRERLTDHTCDRRSSRAWIAANFPEYVFEEGFTEEDELWTGGRWETVEEHVARKQVVLEDIFGEDENMFVGLTVHSYAISAILRAVGLPEFRVSEGSCFALLVRGERVD